MTNLFFGVFTGALGMGYIVYGRRQARFTPLIAGIGLCAYSWFVTNWIWLCVIGALLLVAPFVIDW